MALWNMIEPVEKRCVVCDKTFVVTQKKYLDKKFCSHSCYIETRKGKQWSQEVKDKIIATNIKTYKSVELREMLSLQKLGKPSKLKGVKKPPFTKEHRANISKAISIATAEGRCNGGRGKKGWYVSIKTGQREFYHSTFELRRMKALDDRLDVKTWTKHHSIRIKYDERTYVPDFLILMNDGSTILEEVKGWVASQEVFIRKNQMAKVFCRARGWTYRVVWEKDLETLF